MIVHPELRVLPLRTPTLPPATHTNCYVLGRRAVTVVDPASPWPDEQARLFEALRGEPVERVFLTHHHQDHVGGAVDLAARLGVPIAAHRRTAELLRGQVPVDEFFAEGDALVTDTERWTMWHTPGHASGHLCLVDLDRRAVVAGDMVAGEGTIVLDPPEGDLGQYLDSLQRLLALEPTVLFPAHGPDLREASALLEMYIAHRHMRTAQILAALSGLGEAELPAIVEAVYGDTIPDFIRPVAERQVLCHLLWLAERGELRGGEGGRYQMTARSS